MSDRFEISLMVEDAKMIYSDNLSKLNSNLKVSLEAVTKMLKDNEAEIYEDDENADYGTMEWYDHHSYDTFYDKLSYFSDIEFYDEQICHGKEFERVEHENKGNHLQMVFIIKCI